MISPIEIIGVGSSGLRIVERFCQLLYTVFHENIPKEILRCVVFETEEGNTIDPLVSDINIVENVNVAITADDGIETAENIENRIGIELGWLDAIGGLDALRPEGEGINTIAGSGRRRPFGRLSFWLKWATTQTIRDNINWTITTKEINTAQNRLKKHAKRRNINPDSIEVNDVNKPSVCVVGTLVGGTNSGLFIDLGYLVRDIFKFSISDNLHGIFLIPFSHYNHPGGKANVYGALKELERVSGEGYFERWPSEGLVKAFEDITPYNPLYLVSSLSTETYDIKESTDRDSRRSKRDLPDTTDRVALKLYLDFMGMREDIAGTMVDGRVDMDRGKTYLYTFDIAGVSYPKYDLIEAAACKKGIEICDSLLNEKDADRTNAKERGRNVLNNYIETDVFHHCQNSIDIVKEDGTAQSLVRYVWDGDGCLAERYRRGIADNWNRELEKCEKVIRDEGNRISERLVSSLKESIENEYESNPNLYQIKYFLEGIYSGVDECQAYWSEIWFREYGEELRRQLKPKPFILIRGEATSETFEELSNICIIRALEDVWNNVKKRIKAEVNIGDLEKKTGKIGEVSSAKNLFSERLMSIREYLTDEGLTSVQKVDRHGDFLNKGRIDNELSSWLSGVEIDIKERWDELNESRRFYRDVKRRLMNVIFSKESVNPNFDRIDTDNLQSRVSDSSIIKAGVHFRSGARGDHGYFYQTIGNRTYPFAGDVTICYDEKGNIDFSDLTIWDEIQTAYRNSSSKPTHKTYPFDEPNRWDELIERYEKESHAGEVKEIVESKEFREEMVAFVEAFCFNMHTLIEKKVQLASKVNELRDSDWIRIDNGKVFFLVSEPAQDEFLIRDEDDIERLFEEENRSYLKAVVKNLKKAVDVIGGKQTLKERYNDNESNIQDYLNQEYNMRGTEVNSRFFEEDGFPDKLAFLDKWL